MPRNFPKRALWSTCFLGVLGASSVFAADNTAKGKEIYAKECAACHQQNAKGQGIYPPLASLSKEQIVQKLKGYREGKGGDMKAVMEPYAKGKSDADLEALASYIVTLKK
jgi:cytochrome c553